jgi:hypothetical protein
MSWPEEAGDPYRAMVAEAVAEPVVAAAFCYPAESWVHGPIGTLLRRGIRRVRRQRRWDDRLPQGPGSRQSVVALTTGSLMAFEYRIARGEELGPPVGRWRRDEIAVEARRMQLKQSGRNAQTDVRETTRLNVLRLSATTPDGLLALDLPPGSPGIRDFEHAIGTHSSQSGRPTGDQED